MKLLWSRLDWFIPLSLQGQATVLLITRTIILMLFVAIVYFAALSIGIGLDIIQSEIPYYKGMLVMIASLVAIRSLKNSLLSDSSELYPSVFPQFTAPHTLRLVFLQRTALMVAVLLVPIVVYSSLYLTPLHFCLLIFDELLLLGIIFLIKKGRIRLTLLIVIFILYPTCAISPILFVPLDGTQLGVITIFFGVAYSNTYYKIHVINVIMAIVSLAAYKFLAYFHPSEAIYDTFWIDLLLSITLLIVIVLVFVFYQLERNQYSKHLENFSNFLVQISNLNPHQLYVKDTERRYRFTNTAFQSNFAEDRRSHIGKTLEEIIHVPSEAQSFKEDDLLILKHEQSHHITQTQVTVLNGKKIWLESIKMPITDQNAQVIGLLGISTDITSKKETEQALIESEERYRLIFENSPIGIAVGDKGTFVSVNQAFCDILGYTKEELEGMHLSEILVEEDRERSRKNIQSILTKTKSHLKSEFRVYRKDQTIRSIFLRVRARFTPEQDYIETIASIVDVSSQKEQEALIQQQIEALNSKNKELQTYIESNLQLENFAFLASHDLKAPIRTIGSFAQLLDRSASQKLDRQEKEFLEFIITASRNLYQLTQDLLSYSRVNSKANQFEEFNLKDVIDHILTDHHHLIQETGANIVLDENISTMVGIKSMIHQVFQNLISNALKFSAKDQIPSIFILIEKDTEVECQFAITDNGIGIDPIYYDKIFQLFKKLNPIDQYEGTGIGLALCKKIIDLHQGRIWVESELGKGTIFHFTISKSLQVSEPHSVSPVVG